MSLVSYYKKRPEYLVFRYEETEIIPKEVVEWLSRCGYGYYVKSHQVRDTTSVDRVLMLTKNGTEQEVFDGYVVIFDVNNNSLSVDYINQLLLHYEEAPLSND